MKTALYGFVGVAALFIVSDAEAQIFRRRAVQQHVVPHTTTHIDRVPHTTTHIDYQRHGNHLHAVPHTTTHIDQVPHTTTHFDQVGPHTSHHRVQQGVVHHQGRGAIQQGRVIYPQGQVSTHTDIVPHTTTHVDYQRHGNHVDAVPHTTTHYDRVPHTTYNGVPHSGQTYQNRQVYGNGQIYQSARPVITNRNNNGRVIYPSGQVHSNTHIDYVPHTTTHTDYIRHGNHVDAVPHTTTHVDAVPHTTTHVHP